MKNIGDNIRKYRKRRRLTMADAAVEAGVDRGTWWRWESGQTNLSVSRLVEIAAVLRISMQALTKI